MPNKDKEIYNEYMNRYMKERWRRRRFQAMIYLGGLCNKCGVPYFLEPLQFHHENPDEKTSSIARFSSMNEKSFWDEVEKCILLCDDCHKDRHYS